MPHAADKKRNRCDGIVSTIEFHVEHKVSYSGRQQDNTELPCQSTPVHPRTSPRGVQPAHARLLSVQVIRELGELLRAPDFRRLLLTRLTSQCGDGIFQMGLATVLFFSPERAATAGGVALAYAIMLAPFTLVGPWAGVLLDLWHRRQVLIVANGVRAVLALTIAATLWVSGPDAILYALVLLTLTVNRFILSALSASQPRVVPGPLLLTANSLAPTLGTGAAFLGAGLAAAASIAIPAGPHRNGLLLAAAAALYAVAAAIPRRFRPDQLGPERLATTAQVRRELRTFTRGIAAAAHHLRERRTPALALTVIGVHRLLYGLMFVASLLISRNLLSSSSSADAAPGLGAFSTALAATAAGGVVGAVLTPVLRDRVPHHRWVALALAVAALAQLPFLLTASLTTLAVQAALAGFAAQSLKISVDTVVQRDTDDAFRGRAFALYDVIYNAMFVAAAALAAWLLPDAGYSRPAYTVVSVAFAALGLWYLRQGQRNPVRDVGGAT